MRSIVFIAHGSKSIGMGHLSRCMKLSDYLKSNLPNSQITFLSYVDKKAKEVLQKHHINFIPLTSKDALPQILKYLGRMRPYTIVNDTWTNPKEYYKELKQLTKNLIVIDDPISSQEFSDVIINVDPHKYGRKPNNKRINFYQGLKYLMLPYQIDSFNYEITGDILIFFGGTDFRDAAMKIAKILASKFRDKKFTVIGKPYKNLPANITQVPPFSYPVTSLLKFHNIIITSGASAMYEAVYFKKPTFAFAAQEWEKDNIAYFEERKLVKYIGSYEHTPKQLANKFISFLRKPLQFDFNIPYIDGKGIERVGKIILE